MEKLNETISTPVSIGGGPKKVVAPKKAPASKKKSPSSESMVEQLSFFINEMQTIYNIAIKVDANVVSESQNDVYVNFIETCIEYINGEVNAERLKNAIISQVRLLALLAKITHSYANIYYYAIKGSGDSYYNAMAGIISQGYDTREIDDEGKPKMLGGIDKATYTMSGDRGLSSPYYITTSQSQKEMGSAFMFSKIPQGSSFGGHSLTEVSRKYSKLLYLLVLDEDKRLVDDGPDPRSQLQRNVIHWLYTNILYEFIMKEASSIEGVQYTTLSRKPVTSRNIPSIAGEQHICHGATWEKDQSFYTKLNIFLESDYNICINDTYDSYKIFSTIFDKCLPLFQEDNDKLTILKILPERRNNSINIFLLHLVQTCISKAELKDEVKDNPQPEDIIEFTEKLKKYQQEQVNSNYDDYNPNQFIREVYEILKIAPMDIYEEDDDVDIVTMTPVSIDATTTYSDILWSSPSLPQFYNHIINLLIDKKREPTEIREVYR